MPNQTGQKNQNLIQGRIAYGYDGTDAWPDLAQTTEYSSSAAVKSVRTRPIKTIETVLYAAASLAASLQATSSVLALTGIKKVTIFIDHGRAATTGFTTQGTEYRIEGSQKAADNDTWRTLASVVAGSAAALLVSNSVVAALAGTVLVTSGTGIPSRGDKVMAIQGTIEWMQVLSVNGTVGFNVEDAVTFAHAAGSIYTQAEQFALVVDTGALTRLRVRINNNASATTYAIYSRVAAISEA